MKHPLLSKCEEGIIKSRTFFKFKPLFYLLIILISFKGFAQDADSANPYIDAGDDITIDCGEDCVELTADYLDTGETTSYEVSSIPYDTSYPFRDLENRVSVNIDDRWSSVINLPFDFCFFGNIHSQMIIGSNGVISFDSSQAGGFCSYTLGEREAIPNPNIHTNSIMLFHDINPAYGDNQIGWELFGDAPNRVVVVSFYNVPYYNFANPTNTATSTFQMVMYETTNIIDFFVESKPDPHGHVSSPINGGRAVLGIQNAAGNQGYTPPGRNTGVWEAEEEAWRFMPSGDSNVDFAWLDEDGQVLGTDPTITVCPTDEITTYTARATWINCNGDEITVSDEVTVTREGDFTVDLGDDQEFCDVSEYEITAEITDGNPNNATFLWNTGETTQSIIVTESGTYSVEVTLNDCTITESVTIDFNKSPEVDLGDDRAICFENPEILDATPLNISDYPDPSELIYEWTQDGIILVDETEATLEVFEHGTYGVTVTFKDCFTEDSVVISEADDLTVDIIMDDGIMASAGVIEICPDEPHTLQAVTDAEDPTYQWFLNGDEIVGETNQTIEISIESGTMNTETYSVIISSDGCEASNEIDIRLYPVGNCVISQGLTPNGDGFNDNLDLTFLNDRTGILKLQVFNRYGTKVFEKDNYTDQWYGQTNDGNDLPTGTYYYVIDLVGDDPVYGRQTTGWIYLNQKAK